MATVRLSSPKYFCATACTWAGVTCRKRAISCAPFRSAPVFWSILIRPSASGCCAFGKGPWPGTSAVSFLTGICAEFHPRAGTRRCQLENPHGKPCFGGRIDMKHTLLSVLFVDSVLFQNQLHQYAGDFLLQSKKLGQLEIRKYHTIQKLTLQLKLQYYSF